MLKRLWKDEEGAAAAEYILILAIAAVGIIAVLSPYKNAMTQKLDQATTSIETAK